MLVPTFVVLAAAITALTLLWLRRRGQHRGLDGKVLAPGVSPDTTLMVTDM